MQKTLKHPMFRGLLDATMAVLFVLLFSKRIFSETFRYHEWVGMGICVLFLFHKMLNLAWIRAATRGFFSLKQPFRQRLMWLINTTIFIAVVVIFLSGVLISDDFFPRLMPETWQRPWWCALHKSLSYWALILLAVHTGLHSAFFGVVWNRLRPRLLDRLPAILRRLAVGAAFVFLLFYGANACLYTGLPAKMAWVWNQQKGFRSIPGSVAAGDALTVLKTIPAKPQTRTMASIRIRQIQPPRWTDIICIYGGIFMATAAATAALDLMARRLRGAR